MAPSPGIGRLAGEDLAEDRAQAEHVGPAVDSLDLAGGLLGRHVRGRAQHAAGLRLVQVRTAPHRRDQALLGRGLVRRLVGDASFLQDLGQAPVHHLDLAEAAHHDVRRLQVAVDHASSVGVGHRLADGLEDATGSGAGRAAGRSGRSDQQDAARVRPFDQLHREIRPAVGEGAQLVHRHDAGMLELAADLRFLDEPAHQLGLVLVAFEQDLDGQVAAQVGVAPLEHRPHPAARDLAEELVAVAALGGRGHLIGGRLGDGHAGVVGRRVGQAAPGESGRSTGPGSRGHGPAEPARSRRSRSHPTSHPPSAWYPARARRGACRPGRCLQVHRTEAGYHTGCSGASRPSWGLR